MAQTAIALDTALEKIGAYLNISPAELQGYINEDVVGGWDEDPTIAKWPVGSVWEVEGQILYALVRALKPRRVLEIGLFHGCSTSHIGEAILANDYGQLTSIDIYPMREIPDRYQRVATLVRADIFTYDWKPYDFVFEDAMHSVEMTQTSWGNFARTAPSGAVIVSHDSEHYVVGTSVHEGIRTVTDDYLSLLIAPGKCGLAIWRKP